MSRSSPICTASYHGTGWGSTAVKGAPVSSITSSARTIRRPLLGRMLPAATGSTARSRAYSGAGPSWRSSSSSLARTAGSVPGKSKSSSTART